MSSRPPFDPSLYAIADACATPPASVRSLLESAVSGGVTAVQVRAKKLSGADFLKFASAVVEVAAAAGVAVIINDRVDVALAVRASGVHLGDGDFPVGAAREVLGGGYVIGATAHSRGEIAEADEAGADYIGFGAVYPSPSKDVGVVQGLEGLREARRLTSLPLVAIGGITVERTAGVIAAGADGVAVISGLWSSDDPGARAREYAAAVERGRAERASADHR
jgi:thiamine-phosphate pyrophosphorylase